MIKYPLGISDFKTIREEGYQYIDKSLFIDEVLARGGVQLITRPRRFGKTLNMNMLETFLTTRPEARPKWFEGLAIARTPHMNRPTAPVVFLSLKDLKEADFHDFNAAFGLMIAGLYARYDYLLPHLTPLDQDYFTKILSSNADTVTLKESLLRLTKWLFSHHQQKVVVLIDEYDSPLHEAWSMDYYDDVIPVMRGFLGRALKDNPHLDRAVMTGILRVAKESIFSDLNNLKINSVLSNGFADKFGFTDAEVSAILEDSNLSDHEPVVRMWYNGYRIGGKTIYNPWSLLYYMDAFDEGPKPYWVNTSSNAIIHDLLIRSDKDTQDKLVVLLADECIEAVISEAATFQELGTDNSLLWSLLLFSGYLTVAKLPDNPLTPLYSLKIPNVEVGFVYRQTFARWQDRELGSGEVAAMQKALIAGDDTLFTKKLGLLAQRVMSFYDTGGEDPERAYHTFVLGLLANLLGRYEIRSNREAGHGRYDCSMRPRNPDDPAILIEFKTFKGEDPQPAVKEAFKQIKERGYGEEFESMGLTSWRELAIAFNGKRVHAESRPSGPAHGDA